jgi:rhodanese-related sulfurtransferase
MTLRQTATPPFSAIDAPTLKRWLHDGGEIALLDVREHGQYGQGHPFLAVPLPYSRLEAEIGRLVPRRAARIVAIDDGDGVAARAARAMAGLGYTDLHVLEGGVPAWRDAGYTLFAGVNVPSKTFGELAEHLLHTPRISAPELAARMKDGTDLVVLDGRPYAEYAKMNIPGGICCPNGELALRVQELAPDPGTVIVVNCAGRTRSIIGAQTLIDLGVPNPVYALENGTQGWYLADLELEHGAQRKYPEEIAPQALPALRERAQALARRSGVPMADAAQVRAWLADPARTTYLCDVRTAEEYAAGTLPGAQHTPGGQLIQATDQYVAVRGARLVLLDAEEVRAPVVAAWLGRMGWDAHVLRDGVRADLGQVPVPDAALPHEPAHAPGLITTLALAAAHREGAVLVDVRPSMRYRKAHIAGARWSIRPRLHTLDIPPGTPVVLLAEDAAVGALAQREFEQLGVHHARLNTGTPDEWRQAGLPVQTTDATPADADCIDYLFFVHDRHDGNKAAARQYLAWETDLVNQIDDRERSIFRLPTGQPQA